MLNLRGFFADGRSLADTPAMFFFAGPEAGEVTAAGRAAVGSCAAP